ncbi:response regulator [Amycolatopsis acidicola]|uniref:Response regulator n=1 Tax=Amycolatopsis acidicola TaxID=2596893 RepID=A0A5N0UU20_9PSEU|nr:response regulator [Amycolatopsis acidicola]KAA9153605.1 response regulator [Amycolatopsis acidicola]
MTMAAPAPRVSEEDVPVPRPGVLVVDDNATLRELLVRGLQLEGFDACGAEDALHAIVLLDGFRPDLIVTDVQMPGMSGLDLVRIVRERDTSIPVLVISGRDGESDKAAAFAAGGDAYLVKPFGWAELLHRVHSLLGPAYAESR